MAWTLAQSLHMKLYMRTMPAKSAHVHGVHGGHAHAHKVWHPHTTSQHTQTCMCMYVHACHRAGD